MLMDLDISNYELCQIKYQRFTLSGCKDKEVRKCEFVAKTQFLIPVDPPPSLLVLGQYKSSVCIRVLEQTRVERSTTG